MRMLYALLRAWPIIHPGKGEHFEKKNEASDCTPQPVHRLADNPFQRQLDEARAGVESEKEMQIKTPAKKVCSEKDRYDSEADAYATASRRVGNRHDKQAEGLNPCLYNM
jgi:hypothetical protein